MTSLEKNVLKDDVDNWMELKNRQQKLGKNKRRYRT